MTGPVQEWRHQTKQPQPVDGNIAQYKHRNLAREVTEGFILEIQIERLKDSFPLLLIKSLVWF